MESRGGAVREAEEVDRERAAWKARPFARTFDLIAAEYGWTDDQILDLTMQRMAQIRSVIWERQDEEHRKMLSVKEVELRTLASYIAASAGNEKGVKSAAQITLVPPEKAPSGKSGPKKIDPDRLPSTAMVTRMFSGSR